MKKLFTLVMLMTMFITHSVFAQETAQPEEKPILTFACLSDLHSQQTLISGSVESVRLRGTIQKTLDSIKHEENLDLIVLGGDYLSDVTISYQNYLRTRELLVEATRNTFPEGAKTPVIYINGNHEYEVANFDNVPKGYNAGDYYSVPMKTDIGALADEDCFYEMADNGSSDPVKLLVAYHYVIKGFDFVVLNTGKNFFKGAWNYTYSEESIEWIGKKLEEIYAENPNKTVFFLIHLPFGDSNSISSASKGMTEDCAELLKPILAKYPNLIMFYGHDHGKDTAYIRTNTAQRVTQYDSNGNKWVAPVEEEEDVTTSYAVRNAADGKYLSFDPSTNLTMSESSVVATVDVASSANGTYFIAFPDGTNARYVSSGTGGRFSGNVNQGDNTNLYLYKVEDSKAASGTAKRVDKVENNGAYLIVTVSSKGSYYMLTNEPYGEGSSLRLVGTKVSDNAPGEEVAFENAGNYSPVWIFEAEAEEEEAPAVYNIQNYSTGKYLGFNSCNMANTDEASSVATFTALDNGAFNIHLSNFIASLNNPYVYCGSSGRFSGNKDPQNASSQIMVFEVEDPAAATITATKATAITAGKTYLFVGLKSEKYYALTNEMYKEGDADGQRMVGLEVTIDDNKITYTPSGNYSALWTVNATAVEPESPETDAIAPALCNIQNYNTGKFLGFNSQNLANTNKATSDVTISASTVTKGSFSFNLSRAPIGNPYLYIGSNGRFSGNSDPANTSSQIMAFEVADPTAATITASKAAKITAGKTYLLVGIKNSKYYALTNQMYEENTANQRMIGLEVTMTDDKITYTPSGNYSALWTINEQIVEPVEPGTPSFFSAFMGSMRYYSNSIEAGGSTVNDSRIIQAMMVYVYADRVELKMKNYGESGTINGITINKDLTPYISYRTVEHSAEAVTAAPAFSPDVVGGEVELGQPISLGLNVPEWHNVYYTVDGSTPTEASAKAVNGTITWTPESEGEYVVKIAAQEGIKQLSQSVESPKFTVNLAIGVDKLEVEEKTTIYTITGKEVQANVKNLEKGLYIVNGEKMIVK